MSRISIINLINRTNSNDWDGLRKELEEGSDRATAILGGVFLDERLRELLMIFLVDSKVSKEFQERSISAFSTRINMAYALGLIDEQVRSDLDAIRDIRNAFAHALHGLSFEHPRVVELCETIDVIELTHQYKTDNPQEYRKQFIASVVLLAAYTQAKAAKIEHEKQQRVAAHDLGDFF